MGYCYSCRRDNDGLRDKVTHCEAALSGAFYCDAYCPGCLLSSCQEGKNSCADCRSMAFDTLLEESNVIQAQIDSQREEIERLRQG
jgi:hypothetical protein